MRELTDCVCRLKTRADTRGPILQTMRAQKQTHKVQTYELFPDIALERNPTKRKAGAALLRFSPLPPRKCLGNALILRLGNFPTSVKGAVYNLFIFKNLYLQCVQKFADHRRN